MVDDKVDEADAFLAAAQGASQEEIDAASADITPKLGDEGYVLKAGDEGYVAPAGGELKFGDEGYVLKEGDEGYVAPAAKPFTLSEEDYTATSAEVSATLRSFSENNDTATQAIKEDMLSLFEGATDFDNEGNVLDKDGKHLATYEELVNKVGEEPDANFDTAGNQIDEEGKIIVTKHDLDVADSEVNTIGKEMGFEFQDENGNIKIYPEGNKGLKELALDIAQYEKQEELENYFNSNPLLREVSKHIIAGGELEDFQKPIDYTKVDTSNLTLDQKKDFIRKSYLAEGLAETRAAKLVAGIEEGDATDAEVKEALNILQTKQDDKAVAREEQITANAIAAGKANDAYWEDVEARITKGNLEGFNIPEKDKESFFHYLAIPVKDGQSQDQIDKGKRTREGELKEAYYRFKGYDVSDVVNEAVSTRKVQSLRQRIRAKQELKTGRKPQYKGGIPDISLDTIMP